MRTLIAVLISAALLAPAEAQAKKRVAVLNFDYATVQNSIQSIFGTNQDIGKGIADILVTRLVNSGVYSVIERKALDKVLAEQNFSNSDRVDPSSAAKIGKILGVDGIIIGSITQFGRDDKNVGVTGGAIGGLAGRYGLGGVGKRNAKAVVAINARLINTDTAEILAAAEGKITQELLAAQGTPVDIGGYYFPDEAKCVAAMRPSGTLNGIIDRM